MTRARAAAGRNIKNVTERRIMSILLNRHDRALANRVENEIKKAYEEADKPSAIARRISVVATRYRNRGRAEAVRRHPFRGICEASGGKLDIKDKHLDELEPEKGYRGKVQWVCPRANNGGMRSCDKC